MSGEKGERIKKKRRKREKEREGGHTLALVQASPPGESLFAVCESTLPDRSRDG